MNHAQLDNSQLIDAHQPHKSTVIQIEVDGRIVRQLRSARPITLPEAWQSDIARAYGPNRIGRLTASGVIVISVPKAEYESRQHRGEVLDLTHCTQAAWTA